LPAGYSGTPLPKKLGIREGSRVALLGAPDGFEAQTLGPLPSGVTIRRRAQRRADVVVLFATTLAGLRRRFEPAMRCLEPDGGLWVAWPKKASSLETDLAFETVQRLGLDAGLVDNKICAIDGTWSGLRFVVRLADRQQRGRS